MSIFIINLIFFLYSNTHVQAKLYDYIIVGGGTAGCPLAATLSQRFKVLLLERGGAPDPIATHRDSFILTYENQIGINTPVQGFTSTDGVRNARARVLGGGSSINAGFYNRASPETIASMGLNQSLVNESFQWVESVVASIATLGPYQTAFRQSLIEAGVTPDNGASYDFHVGTQTGGTIFDIQGRRRPASDLLVYVNSTNLDVMLHVDVEQISFQGLRAEGVTYIDSLGLRHTASLKEDPNSEVIVCAGVLGSPQLLLLSGIGPADHLASMGIEVKLNLSGVGQQLKDNPTTRTFIVSPSPVESSLVQVAGVTALAGNYIEAASGQPIGVIPGAPLAAIVQKTARPLSSGSLSLVSTDVRVTPRVTFNYFQNPQDLQQCVEGLNKVEEVVLANSFRPFVTSLQPLPSGGTVGLPLRRNPLFAATVNTTLAIYCRTQVATLWHYHGGCLPGQVVDSEYKVLGTQGLRVVDTSTFFVSPGTNPMATVMMLGRYVGVKILEAR